MSEFGKSDCGVPKLGRLLAPRSIAVVGGGPAERVVRQCLKLGFEGAIWPVHPKRDDIAGIACLPSLDELPGIPDAVFLGVNRHATIEAIHTISRMGAGGAVCYSSGFAETDDDDLQAELLQAAGAMPFFGPNCYGFVNTFDRVALWPDEHGCGRHERGVAIVSQSGNVAVNFTFQQRGLRLGTMISVGNQASLGSEDAVAALLDDDRITAIGLFLEAVRDAQRFAEVAERAAEREIGLVALQTGRSAAGAQIANSHTGSMAGRAAAYDALFARYGVATVRTPAEMLETLKLLDNGGRLSGRRIVSLSCSGGEASLVADRSEGTTLRFEPFGVEHQARIAATVTELVTVGNPFDYQTFMWGDHAAMTRTFTAVMDGPQDMTMLLLDGPTATDNDPAAWYLAADALADAAAATGGRAIVVATLAECIDKPFRDHLAQRGLTALLGLSETLAALAAAASVGQLAASGRHAPAGAAARTRLVDEAKAKERLSAMGVAVPIGRAVSAQHVQATADDFGYPITLKSLGHAHKSEAGAVRVGVPDAAALSAALGAMPNSSLGYLVEATVTDVVAEVLVGVRRDPPIGWLVSLGHGGVTTELWNDVTHLLAPVTADELRHAPDRLRSAALLRGFRGRPPADVDALVDLIARLCDAVVGSDIVEIELNPVLVGRRGATAVDALLVVED
ncbi:MAG: acetate--CoA ligase family protein [Actinobacteria bacterium]|nr:acetate--CoA ligase family protein [Actinomycetota bacterium]